MTKGCPGTAGHESGPAARKPIEAHQRHYITSDVVTLFAVALSIQFTSLRWNKVPMSGGVLPSELARNIHGF